VSSAIRDEVRPQLPFADWFARLFARLLARLRPRCVLELACGPGRVTFSPAAALWQGARLAYLASVPRASGCSQALDKHPHKMGSEKGNVKIRRKVGRPQVVERIGSSGWIRTTNPPVNSVTQVVGLAGSSCR
jgi:hypothetical protein